MYRKWFEIAIQHENYEAYVEAGVLYYSGLGGLEQDQNKAMEYFDIAEKNQLCVPPERLETIKSMHKYHFTVITLFSGLV